MQVHSATCSCSAELYKQWYTLADFFQTGIFAGFSLHIMNNAVRISEAAIGGAGEIIQYFLRGYSLYYSIRLKDQRSCDGQDRDLWLEYDKYDNIREMYYTYAGFFQNWNFSL